MQSYDLQPILNNANVDLLLPWLPSYLSTITVVIAQTNTHLATCCAAAMIACSWQCKLSAAAHVTYVSYLMFPDSQLSLLQA